MTHLTKQELIAGIQRDVLRLQSSKRYLTEDGELKINGVWGVKSVTDKHATTYWDNGIEKKVPLSRVRKCILEAINAALLGT
jgi:hypothetical protein